ncbi:hypothetical protein ANCDUO_00727 [Ancylostoma duodenale]|uniref:Calponin-homology (CH) domain-containing protein n=1 Tax=Ancylostoma duodenale TaxID=51022 RepID=A0A0C2E0T7_9BILA|nr:hypothetical protein ANCDUO_00727 [Ancylostoma duodenale]
MSPILLVLLDISLVDRAMSLDYFVNRGQAAAAEETGRCDGASTAVAGGATAFDGAGRPQTHPCTRYDAWNVPASLALLLLLLFSTVLTMYKVLRSYSKKAERKQEVSRASDRNGHIAGNYYDEAHHKGYENGHHSNGQLLAVDNRHLSNAYAAGQAFSESSSYETREHFERKVQRVKKTRGERERSRSSRRGDEVTEALHASDASSARDALLQWARKVTSGYPRVNVTNFSSSWKDGLAFNAILHRYRPNLIDWNKVSDSSVSNRERLENAFAAAEREFGVDRLLDPQDVDTDHPDEKSIITYVSSLYNALPHLPELAKVVLDHLFSSNMFDLTILNTVLVACIEEVESRVDSARPGEIERAVNEIVDDLNALEIPIGGFFEDVEELKANNHPEANDFYRQVYGLHQRRTAYLDRLTNQILVRLGVRTETLRKENAARLESVRTSTFNRVQECIEWVRVRLEKLSEMEFLEDLETLEEMFEQHKLDNRDIQDFRQNVDECIARQLLHEMELREKQYNDVHNQGAALLNQGHPAVHVIEVYLRTMQNQWDWLLALSKCLEEHLRDALNLKSFTEEAADAEAWMEEQAIRLENNYNRTDFDLEEGERLLRELDEMKEILNKYHSVLMALTERCATISPLWQRGERISRPITVTALCDYSDKNVHIKAGDEVTLLDNSDLIKWHVRDLSGAEGTVPSVVFRIPPPDPKLTAYLNRLLQQFEKLKKLWEKKHRMVRFNMVLNTMKTIQGWDLDTFNAIDPEQRDAIMRALNDDANKLLAEMDPNDPLALRLKEELRRTNEHFWNLLNASQKPPEPDHSTLFDEKIGDLLRKLEDAWRKLNDNAGKPISRTPAELESVIVDHKSFEDALQVSHCLIAETLPLFLLGTFQYSNLKALDADVANVKELFRQLPNPTPTQRVNNDRLNGLWEDLWDLSRMYVERIKVLESVLNGILEVSDIVRAHEITLNSFDDLPAALDKLRGHHSQLLEMNMVLQQQQTVVDALNKNVALLRQHVARTRIGQSSHPDVDRVEDEVQQLNVRWENVCAQVAERLKAAERALQTQMVYRSEYENEMAWLDRVEETINKLRKPEELHPEQYQQQLDLLVAEYAQLQERTEAIENVNREGGKFIREAKGYDSRMGQFHDTIVGIHGPAIKQEFRRTKPQPKNGAQIVTEELEALNRRFAQLSSLILERRNTMQVLIQNWKRQKQEEEDRRKADEEAKRRAFEAARLKALEDADRLRREREAAEAARRAAEEADRARRLAEEADRARRAAEEAERRRREEEERKRREDEERKRREDEERRRREEEERRRREEEERRRREEAERERRRREDEDKERKRREDEDREKRRREDEDRERRRREDEERERERRRREEEERRRREEEERRRREEERRRKEQEKKKMPPLNIVQGNQMHEVVGQENPDEWEVMGDLPDVAKITEHEDEMQMYQEETVTKTQFYEMEGTLHKQTGEILTFVEAVRQGLLDLSAGGGQFFDIHSGRISLEKAVELGYIDGTFNDVLNTRYGIRHPETRSELTLLQAIQIGLYDPETRHLYDIHTGDMLDLYDWVASGILTMETQRKLVKMGILKLPPMALHSAIDQGVLNTVSGHFVGKYSHESMPIKDALYHGYLQLVSPQQIPMIAITLTDAIREGFINANNGEFVDKNTKDTFTLREACSKQLGLLNLYVPEVVNTAENTRLDLKDAMLRNAINTRNGNFTDLQTRRTLSLREAYAEDLISKPATLTEMLEKDLIDSTNHFIDRGTKHRHTILEAIAAGLLDAEVRHIVDPDEKDVISIAEAMERGILGADGKIILEKQQKEFTIPEAVREGLLTKRVRHSIFDVRGIQNTRTGQTMSFNEACEAGAIIPNAERVVDLATQESYLISDQKATAIIDQTLHELLVKPVGIRGDRGDYDLNLVRAVSKGIIDPSKAVFFNKNTKHEMSAREAYDAGLVSLRGAIQVAALFDVSPSLIAPVKKVEQKKRVSRPGQTGFELATDQVKVTLAEAMKQGLIDSRNQRFRQGDIDMSLDDALNQGLIDPSSEWIVPSKSNGTGQQLAPKYYPDKNIEESVTTVKRVRTTETTALGGPGGVSVYRAITGGKGAMEVPANGYHIYEAERKGIIDLSTGNITSPNVDRAISFADGIELGVIDSSSISVKDPKTGRTVSVKEALEKKILGTDGSISQHGKTLTIEKAIEAGLIIVDAEAVVPAGGGSKNIIHIPSGGGPVISFRPVGVPVVEESEQSWSFDSTKGLLVDHLSGERLTLEQALLSGKIAPEDLAVRDALTGREMSFSEAEKWGIIDKKGYYLDKIDNKRLSFTEAAQQHRIYPTGGVPDNAGDAVHTSVKVQTRTQVAKKEASSTGTAHIENTLGKALSLGWYDANNGMFTHPDTNRQMTLKEAIIKGLFNPYDTSVVDKKNNKTLSLLEAIQEGIVDDTAGTVLDTQTQRKHDLNSALQMGILKGKSFGDSLESGLFSGRLDLATGHYTQPGGAPLPLHEALNKNLIDHSTVVVRDPASGVEYSYKEAVSRRIVDPERGLIHNQQTNEATSFPQALTTGLIAGAGSTSRPSHSSHKIVEQKLQLTPFAPKQVIPSSRNGSDRHEYVDLGGGKQVMVKVVRGEGGVEKGEYVDPSTGMKFTIQMHGDPFVTETKTTVKSTSQVQSVELEPHAEFVGIDRIRDKRNNRTMSLEDAKRMGLARVDKKGKQMTKTYSVFRSNIQNALSSGVLDAHMEKISLEDAIRAGIIDIRELSYRNPKSGESIPLTQAANMGLVDVTLAETLPKGVCNPANNERIPIKRAIELGIVDARTGEVRDPHTRKRLTWLDIIKSVYQAITSDGVFDPTKGQRVPVTNALNEGLIDTKIGKYHNPITLEDIELKDAVDRGLIDSGTYEAITKPFLQDYRTNRHLNLIDAVEAKLVDPKNKTIQLSRHSIVPIAKAVEDGRIPSEIGEKLRQIDKLNFAEALGKGLIDVSSNIFTDPDTGRQITIAQAIEQGYIDTGNVEAMEGSDEKNLCNILNSEEFDENSGRIRDKRTSLHLTFKDAVERDVIDGDSLLHDLESGQTLTLREALVRKKIDNDGKYIAGNLRMTLRDAVKGGLIALIASPMQAAQAVAEAVKRRDAEGYKFKIENVDGGQRGSRTSVPKFREESSVIRLTPHKQEPSLTVRMRHSQTNIGDRARSIIDDPSTLADLQHEFLANLEANRFDTDEKVITNPSGGQRLSVREAAETGLLDVLTGEIVVPDTGRRYSIPKAVHLNYVQGDAAKRLMESLNMSIEELNLAQQQSTPSPSGGEAGVSTRTWTKTVNWHGQPSELRKSRTDPLAAYTTYSSSTTEKTHDAPSWAR